MMIPDPTKTTSIKPTPSDIQSKELEKLNADRKKAVSDRKTLEDSQDRWHTTYLVLGGFGALLVIASWWSQRLESAKSYAQRPLTEQIAAIDTRISAINDEVSNAAIVEASFRASQADESAGKANERAGELENEAANERKRADLLEHQTAELKGANLKTETRLEEERLKRVKLAASLIPRTLFDQSGAEDILKDVPPHRVVFVYANDTEARQLAEQIAWIFASLHWPFFGGPSDSVLLRDGVMIDWGGKGIIGRKRTGSEEEEKRRDDETNKQLNESANVTDKLREALTKAGVSVSVGPINVDWEQIIDPDTVIIGVGAKPIPPEVLEGLNELGTPAATPTVPNHNGAGLNRMEIPKTAPPGFFKDRQ